MIPLSKMNGLPCVVLGLVLLMTGCSSAPHSTEGSSNTPIRVVNVGQNIAPLQINGEVGDTVRWVNQESQPIAVIFPRTDAGRISCQTGFKSGDQGVLSAVIEPHSFASLCFTEQGKYNYVVRLNIPSALIDQIASVWIVGNSMALDQFEKMTP